MASNFPVQVIPTDRHGNVYHGPTTVALAMEQIGLMMADDQDGSTWRYEARALVLRLRQAGYTGVAARIRKRYDL